MKTTIALTAAAMALMVSGVAIAEEVEIGGEAEPMCTLPSSWAFVSANAGAGSSQFSGATWTIPQAVFANATSNAVVSGSEYAIRIRGTGTCNTSHTITLTSLRGGLANEDTATAPSGFARSRPMKYDAYWSQGGNAFGPSLSYTPTTPGQQFSRAYTVSGSLAPPGNRTFDIRLGLQRGAALAQPLISGDYSDTVTVTLALAP